MRRLFALSAVPALGLLVLVPAPGRAQGNGPCIHQGRQVQCPPGLPPGSQSVAFVPGGTNWRNSVTGQIVFVPSTTFPTFMAGPTPTAPPGPTTQPGPGQPSGGPPLGAPVTGEGQIYLTQPSDRQAAPPLPSPERFRERLAEVELEQAQAAEDEAFKEVQRVEAGFAEGSTDPKGIATKDRSTDYRGRYPATRIFVIQVTPELRAASARYWELSDQHFGDERSLGFPLPYSDEFKQASRGYEAAFDTAPVDQAATERVQRARDAYERATEDRERALDDYEDATGQPARLYRGLRAGKLPPVEQSDAEKAPTFEPFKDQGAVDEVM